MFIGPWAGLFIGFISGFISVIGYKYLTVSILIVFFCVKIWQYSFNSFTTLSFFIIVFSLSLSASLLWIGGFTCRTHVAFTTFTVFLVSSPQSLQPLLLAWLRMQLVQTWWIMAAGKKIFSRANIHMYSFVWWNFQIIYFSIFSPSKVTSFEVLFLVFCILVFIWCFLLVPHLIWRLMRYSWALNQAMAEQLVSRLDTSWLYWPAHSSLQGLVDCSQVRERKKEMIVFLRRFLSLLLKCKYFDCFPFILWRSHRRYLSHFSKAFWQGTFWGQFLLGGMSQESMCMSYSTCTFSHLH